MVVRKPIPFFTDNDVADSVGEAIIAAGHQLTRLRDYMLTDSPDEIVAAACRAAGLVLVTHNYRDFRQILKREADLTKRQANHLCRIELSCKQFRGAERLSAEVALIEHEWARYRGAPDQPMRIEIGDTFIRLGRDWEREAIATG